MATRTSPQRQTTKATSAAPASRSKKTPASYTATSPDASDRAGSARTPIKPVAQPDRGGLLVLVALGMAIVLGALGFLLHPLWIAAIVVMALAWGSLVSGRQSTRERGGLASELVATVAEEIQGITDSAAGSNAKVDKASAPVG